MFKRFPPALVVATLLLAQPAQAARTLEAPALVTPAPTMPHAAEYRSPGATRKVIVEGAQRAKVNAASPTRQIDYGPFALLELDVASAEALIKAGLARNADAQNLILLNTGAIDTTSVVARSINASKAAGGGPRLHLVQFPGPIQDAWVSRLSGTGAQLVSYMANNAYLVYGDAAAIDAVNRLTIDGTAQWAAPYLDSFKLQPGVREPTKVALPGPPGRPTRYQVQLFRDPAVNQATETLLSGGSRSQVWRYEVLNYVNIVVEIPVGALDAVAARPDVVSIAPYIEPVKHDERQNMILAGNLSAGAPVAGNYFDTLANWGFTQAQFNASGTIVDVTDDGADRNPTGADPGTIATNANAGPVLSRHFVLREGGLMANASRFIYKGRWGSASTADGGLGVSGHGQLNMSIVGGFVPDALDPGGTRVHRDPLLFRYGLGVAPFVRMANSVIFDPDFTDPNFPDMLAAGYALGTRISSNSWGAPVGGAYNADAQAYDALVRDSRVEAANQEMIIVFSAGNSGPGANTIGAPGTGKNVLTVGAAENAHPFATANGGGNATGADGCGINDAGANNADDVISFSSRGPTDDGRIKPDIQAPGTHITGMTFVTTTSSGTGTAEASYRADGVCGGSSSNFFPIGQQWYTASSGTSHSAPAVAGGAALVHQQFINNPSYLAAGRNPAGGVAPSPAMVKAYLTNSARYMTGVSANDTLPSNSQGMGMMNLGMAFDGVPRVTRDQVAGDTFGATGEVRGHTAFVAVAGQPVRISLAWTDAPGPTSGSSVVNNLDLSVTIDGNTYRGNVFSGATSTTGGVADLVNNLESVFLPAGFAAGTPITITVSASNIAGNGVPGNADATDQDYALVVYNAASSAVPADPTSTSVTSSANPVLKLQPVTFTATSVNTTTSNPVATGTTSFYDGLAPICTFVPVNASGVATCTTSALSAGPHTITATYNGDLGLAGSSGTLNQVVTPIVEPAFVGATVTGDNNRLDPNDCNALSVSVINNGGATGTAVSAVLSSSTPGVTITQAVSAYPDLSPGGSGSNLTPFQVSLASSVPQASTANFTLTLTFAGGGASPAVFNFSLPVGTVSTYVFASSTGATIPAAGVLVPGSAADDAVVTTTIPFDIQRYGATTAAGSTITLSTNGNIQFVAVGGVTSLTNVALPGPSFPNAPVLMPYWDDLILTTPGGGIYVQTLGSPGSRQFIVEWRGRRFGDGSATQNINFAVVFTEGSSSIEYRYLQTGIGTALNGVSSTVGLQAGNTSATSFTQYSFNQGVITAGLVLTANYLVPTLGPGQCPTQLAFNTQPSNTTAGVAVSPAVTVRLLDADGALTTSTATVTMALGANPGSSTLAGTTSVAAVGGVATFSNLSLDKVGTGYTLAASSTGLTGATSSGFNITPAAPAQLAFVQQPTNATGGAPISPAITVRALDAFGNPTSYSGNITLAIGTNPSGGSLSGTTTVAAVGGIATFSGLSINTAGSGYTLAASSSGLTGATSSAFDITVGAPVQLAFVQQPSNTASTQAIAPAPSVRILDAGGNQTASSANVTLAIGTNPAGGTLSGTTTVAAVAGVATFPGLSINSAGTGYTLTASSGALTGATSTAFNITVGAPAQLAFGQQPGNTAGGAAIAPAPTVRILDAGGNLTGSTASVTLAIGSNPSGGTLSGTATATAVAGVASFPGLSINTAGNGYTLAASSSGLAGTTSAAFNITVGAAAQLAFGQQPTDAVANQAIVPAPTVRILDAGGNLTASTANVTIAIGANPGSSTLGGTTTVAAVAGVATFANLTLSNQGVGYTLTATSAGLTGSTSSAFNVVCAPTVVSNSNDSGAGSLRQAIADACAGSTITFAIGVTASNLTSAELLINKDLTIDGGAGVTVTRVAGSPDFRIFRILAGSVVTLDSLMMSNGRSNVGGVIRNQGNLTILDAVISGGFAGADGGGIYNQDGVLQISNSTISGNTAANIAGGITNVGFSVAASATIINSSIVGNQAAFTAGMTNQGATLSLTNSTIANNESTGPDPFGDGSGFANVASGFATTATLVNCTFNGNRHTGAGSPVADDIYSGNFGLQSTVIVKNTILGGSASTAAPNLITYSGGIITSQGNNLSSDAGAGLLTGPGDLINTDPLLAMIGNYGGATSTFALLPGSPAINAGNNTGAPANDQRGIARPQQGTVDIGAYESRGFTLAVAGGNNQSAGPGLAFANPLGVSVAPVAPGEPVDGGLVSFTPPSAGASASLSPNPATISGGSASSTATANATVGSYSVAANANGASAPVSFTLTNAGADLSIDDVSLTEGNAGTSNAVFTVTRSNSLTAFSVPYSLTAGSAQAGSDYTATSGTLNFAVGGPLTQTITVPVVGDLVVEGSETATLNLGAVSNTTGTTTITDGSGLLTITDNDSAVVNFAPAGVSQSEGSSPMVFTVTLSNPVASGVTLTLNSANGTATAADYTPIVGAMVSFPASSAASQTVNVAIANDALDEDDETFSLTLSGLTATGNVTLGTATANGTILDDDATPTLSITSPSQNEGNAGTSTMNFVVSLSAVSGRAVSFTRATADGTATVANNDYVAIASGSLSIPAGQSSVTIPVTINGDTTFEGNETFSVNLSGITNATPGTLTGTGTLVEDDQQPTTTTITSDLPDPSVVGQPYTVSVNVAAVTTSPTGTVTISDGSASCGPVTLTAGTAPNSTASCSLTSTTAGAKTLTASYTAATTAFGNSSGTTTHQVNPASTSISVTGPTRSRINQPTAFSFALSVNAPGAGTPTGTVTLSSGASSCTATLPATSCSLSFNTLGSRTVSASYAGDGNFSGSTSSGAGNAQTLVYALSDLQVTKTDGLGTYAPGDLIVYSVIVRNLGPDAAANIRVQDAVPAGLVDVTWSCDASGGVACPVSGGTGNLDLTIAGFPVGGLLNLTFYGNVDGSPASIANTATITLPADTTIEDPVLGNNSATDTDLLDGLFANGFESPQVNAQSGSVRIPALALGRSLGDEATIVLRLTDANGEAVRVYARLHETAIEYAVAKRAANGQLRLGAWTALPGEPTLSWTARQTAAGWVVETVELR